MLRTFRLIWGILTLLSLAWICYGIVVASNAYGNVVSNTTSEAGKAGASVGAGLGMTFYLCSGGIPLLLFGFLYWRNGIAMKNQQKEAAEEKRHQEIIEAMKKQQ